MRATVPSTFDPPPLVRGQLPGASADTWRDQREYFRSLSPREAREYAREANARARVARTREADAHARRLGELTAQTRQTQQHRGRRLDVAAIYQRFNNATPAPTSPPQPARPRSFHDIARSAYGEAPAPGTLVPSSARGGR